MREIDKLTLYHCKKCDYTSSKEFKECPACSNGAYWTHKKGAGNE